MACWCVLLDEGNMMRVAASGGSPRCKAVVEWTMLGATRLSVGCSRVRFAPAAITKPLFRVITKLQTATIFRLVSAIETGPLWSV